MHLVEPMHVVHDHFNPKNALSSCLFCASKMFWKGFFYIYIFIFLNRFDMLMLKINLKNKKYIISIYF